MCAGMFIDVPIREALIGIFRYARTCPYDHVHVYAHVYTHVHVHVYTHACTHAYAHADTHAHTLYTFPCT